MRMPCFMRGALLLLSLVSAAADFAIDLPAVSFTDLFQGDEGASQFLAKILTTLGALQITDIPGYNEARYEALHGLSECMTEDTGKTSVVTLKDGSQRFTVAAGTVERQAGTMSSECGHHSSKLRNIVHNAMYHLAQSLDDVINNNNYNYENRSSSSLSPQFLMSPYSTYAELVEHGSHLEHMHSYSFVKSEDTIKAPTLDFHTDGGLFIGMTTGMYSAVDGICDENGLYIKDTNGVSAHVIVPDSSLIVMIGEGGSRMLSPLLGHPLRAVPHKLNLCVRDASSLDSITRSWYGKMFLPPNDAIVNILDGLHPMKYEQFRVLEVQSMRNHQEKQVIEFPTVCGSLKLQDMVEASASDSCADNEVLCWTQCMPTDNLPCGTDAQCFDPVTDQVVDGSQMCPEDDMTVCELQCVYNETDPGFCYGSGTVMFMDGFRSFASDSVSNCLNLWFIGWELDDGVKVAVACLGVLVFGIAAQFISALRLKYNKAPLLSTFLFSIHITASYFLMLAAMTYSVEIFCMVCIGLTIGHFVFHTNNGSFLANLRGSPNNIVTTDADPCCAGSATHHSNDRTDRVADDFKSPLIIPGTLTGINI